MDETDMLYRAMALCLDKVIDQIWPLRFSPAERTTPLRLKVAAGLQPQLISVARSIVRLTQISGKTDPFAIDESTQIILSSTRVLTEACNKFYYLVIDPKTEQEFERRFAYYTLVGSRNFRNLVKNTNSDAATKESADRIYEDRKRIFSETTPDNWPPFAELGPDEKKLVLKGRTVSDYIESDFNAAIDERLNQTEKLHYQGLGNVAIHSSSVLLFMQQEQKAGELSNQMQLTTTAIFNAAKHLALHALEVINFFPEMGKLTDKKTIADLDVLAREIRRKT